MIAADTEVRNEIEGFARSQLERRGDTRSLEDKLKIAAESNHLVKAFQTSEGQRLMRKAELKSAQVYWRKFLSLIAFFGLIHIPRLND